MISGIALVTAELEDDPGWHQYLGEGVPKTKAKRRSPNDPRCNHPPAARIRLK
jgi:hypothetical protein